MLVAPVIGGQGPGPVAQASLTVLRTPAQHFPHFWGQGYAQWRRRSSFVLHPSCSVRAPGLSS